jgi:hypothetical protein
VARVEARGVVMTCRVGLRWREAKEGRDLALCFSLPPVCVPWFKLRRACVFDADAKAKEERGTTINEGLLR